MVRALCVAFLLLLSCAPESGFCQGSQARLAVVATTTLIGSIVQEIGGDKIDLITVIPPGTCPGHFDFSPHDVIALEAAQIVLCHGFEGEGFFIDVLHRVQNKDILISTVAIEGNWMVPSVYLQAIDAVCDILTQINPENKKLFLEKKAAYKNKIDQLAQGIQNTAADLRVSEMMVACADMQADFLRWLGFKVSVTYPRPDDFTPVILRQVITESIRSGVVLVVDNLQSGLEAGRVIQENLGCKRIVLTNFPQEFAGKISYIETLQDNVSRLFMAVQSVRSDNGVSIY